MTHATTATRPAIDYRFNTSPADMECPLCSGEFELSIGMWPFLSDTDQPVCGRSGCSSGESVDEPLPCQTLVEFAELDTRTVDAIRVAEGSVAERFRTVSLGDDVPENDRKLLQLAAIDLQYCQADDTRIESFEPRLTLRTCGEAAAELLLSGCVSIA